MAIIIVQKAKKALFYGIFDIMSLMKNNILYIIGVAFALILMVFFSGFSRNVDFFPAEPKIMNGKTILIETFNDKKADKYWKSQFIKLYENSDFKPTDEMFDNASLCFKEEVFENIINNENEKYQKILETEIKIETKDQLTQESLEILTEFQRNFQSAVNSCKKKHIKDKNKDVYLECEASKNRKHFPYDDEDIETGKVFIYFNRTEVPFDLMLTSPLANTILNGCEIKDGDMFGDYIICSNEGGIIDKEELTIQRDTGYLSYNRTNSIDSSTFITDMEGYCTKSEKKNIF